MRMALANRVASGSSPLNIGSIPREYSKYLDCHSSSFAETQVAESS